ncbi:MAG: helix-hairpin-helix domain-containing protein [Porticoccaceae bacterium]|nr:helix-hairpin-helix domain-containing protein [Porticoccaceae bacterium]
MKILVKTLLIMLSAAMLLPLQALANPDPNEEKRSLVVMADYQPININEASATEIAAALKGVGMKTAKAIVAYRKANGPFEQVGDLRAVKGVGARTLSKNQRVIMRE